MHPNPVFRETAEKDRLALARWRAFGLLAFADGDAAPLVAHVPILLSDVALPERPPREGWRDRASGPKQRRLPP